jgi:hypothetical protein
VSSESPVYIFLPSLVVVAEEDDALLLATFMRLAFTVPRKKDGKFFTARDGKFFCLQPSISSAIYAIARFLSRIVETNCGIVLRLSLFLARSSDPIFSATIARQRVSTCSSRWPQFAVHHPRSSSGTTAAN